MLGMGVCNVVERVQIVVKRIVNMLNIAKSLFDEQARFNGVLCIKLAPALNDYSM